eukprot:SAG31_NODE_43617_length_266_cov_0.838323_1_plen_31_part_10
MARARLLLCAIRLAVLAACGRASVTDELHQL